MLAAVHESGCSARSAREMMGSRPNYLSTFREVCALPDIDAVGQIRRELGFKSRRYRIRKGSSPHYAYRTMTVLRSTRRSRQPFYRVALITKDPS
jgi:hypothetical protein